VLNGAFFSLQYDVLNDFAPISPLVRNPLVLSCRGAISRKQKMAISVDELAIPEFPPGQRSPYFPLSTQASGMWRLAASALAIAGFAAAVAATAYFVPTNSG
jgi:hypothetical protein